MEAKIRKKYQKYSKDGNITAKEVRKVVEKNGGKIDETGAQRLLLQMAGSDRRMTENEFTYGIMNYIKPGSGPSGGTFNPENARAQLNGHYSRACSDGIVNTSEVIAACALFGVGCDTTTANSLLQQIAGPERRITQPKFVDVILAHICMKKGLPPPPAAGPPFDVHTARPQLSAYYASACSDGVVDSKEIAGACGIFGVPCDPTTANGLIQQIAGPERRITQQKFVEVILGYVCMKKGLPPPPPPFDVNTARPQLAAYYSSACSDGVVDSKEIAAACGIFGVPCDPPTANGLIQQIAGPERRITQQKFVEVILGYVCLKKGLPPPPAPAAPTPAYSAAPAPPPPGAPGGMITSGPSATHPNPAVAAWLVQFYAAAAHDGSVDTSEVIRACRDNRVGCDESVARTLLGMVAAPDGRITQEKFVHHIGVYITRNQK